LLADQGNNPPGGRLQRYHDVAKQPVARNAWSALKITTESPWVCHRETINSIKDDVLAVSDRKTGAIETANAILFVSLTCLFVGCLYGLLVDRVKVRQKDAKQERSSRKR
jgi:hypothetical protein